MFAMFKSYNNIYKKNHRIEKKPATIAFIMVLKMECTHFHKHLCTQTLYVGRGFTIKTNIQLNRMLKLIPLRFLSCIVCIWMIKLFNRIPNSIKYPFNNNNKNSSFLLSSRISRERERAKAKRVSFHLLSFSIQKC